MPPEKELEMPFKISRYLSKIALNLLKKDTLTKQGIKGKNQALFKAFYEFALRENPNPFLVRRIILKFVVSKNRHL